jgi:hypothetical protein
LWWGSICMILWWTCPIVLLGTNCARVAGVSKLLFTDGAVIRGVVGGSLSFNWGTGIAWTTGPRSVRSLLSGCCSGGRRIRGPGGPVNTCAAFAFAILSRIVVTNDDFLKIIMTE